MFSDTAEGHRRLFRSCFVLFFIVIFSKGRKHLVPVLLWAKCVTLTCFSIKRKINGERREIKRLPFSLSHSTKLTDTHDLKLDLYSRNSTKAQHCFKGHNNTFENIFLDYFPMYIKVKLYPEHIWLQVLVTLKVLYEG